MTTFPNHFAVYYLILCAASLIASPGAMGAESFVFPTTDLRQLHIAENETVRISGGVKDTGTGGTYVTLTVSDTWCDFPLSVSTRRTTAIIGSVRLSLGTAPLLFTTRFGTGVISDFPLLGWTPLLESAQLLRLWWPGESWLDPGAGEDTRTLAFVS